MRGYRGSRYSPSRVSVSTCPSCKRRSTVCRSYPAVSGEPYPSVFPTGVIPQKAWSNPAKALLQYVPQPNRGDANFSTSRYNQLLRDNEGALRVDANTRWGSLAAYYSLDDFFQDNPYPTGQGGANVPGFNATSLGRAQLFSLGVTKALSPNTLNEFHLSYMRFANRVGQPVGGVGPKLSDQGFVEGPGTLGIVPLAPKIEGIENVSFNDFTFGVDTTGETQVNNTYQGTDNFSKVIGKHSLKVGGGLHLDQVNVNPDAVFNGSFQFVGTETGSDFADFLLGVASYYRQGDSKSFYLRHKYVGLFAQDNWQVRPNVTLTYGLRWEYLQSLLISALKRLAGVRLPPLPPLSILLSISYGLLLVSYNGILQGGFSAGLSRCSHYALIRTSFTRQGLHRTASAE